MSTPYPSRMLLAIQATLFIAYHSNNGVPVKSTQIIERYALNRRALEPVLQILTLENVLDSRQGANGGYTVINRKETLGRIARLFMDNVTEEDLLFNDLLPVIQPQLLHAMEALFATLDNYSIEDCCEQAHHLGIPRGDNFPLDFII